MSIAELVHTARRARNLTQRELSHRSRVAQSSLSDLESGRRSPSMETVDRLLLATGHRLIAIPTRRSDAASAAVAIAAPPRTGEKRWDAAVAGLVEHRLEEEGLPLPSWVGSEDRRLQRSWTFGDGVDDLPVEPARALPAFRRHGVLLDPDTLASV